MNYVRVATIGPNLLQEIPESYEKGVERMIGFWQEQVDLVLPDKPDLIVLPECSDRFKQYPVPDLLAYYDHRGDRVRDFWARIARENHTYVTYPAVRVMDDGTRRNSMQLLDRNGHVAGTYDKRHAVIAETELWGIQCGRGPVVMETDFGRVGTAICFDLNFDRLREQYKPLKPHLIVFPSMYHGGLMFPYWAYYCRCYMVSALPGHMPSSIVSPVGHEIASTTNYYQHLVRPINLDYAVVHLDGNREKLRAMKDRHGPDAAFFDPGHLGSVLITSETQAFTADDLVAEFEFELLDDYLRRSLAHHDDPANIGSPDAAPAQPPSLR